MSLTVSVRWMRTSLPAFACAMSVLHGCASKSDRDLKPRELTLQEFAGPAPATAPDQPAAAAMATTSPATAPATQPVVPLVATGSAPLRKPVRLGEPVIVESVIGQVAGRPIFANTFLALGGLNDRLRAMSAELDSREFAMQATQIINAQLQQEVLNFLFLAEAQASLTEQQKVGLLAFMQRLREDVIGRGRGSELFTQSELAEKGMTLDQYLEIERDKTLIGSLIREKITPRVIVSWRDVEREYQRRFAEFNPPATVTLIRIRLPQAQKEEVEKVKQQFAAGASFDEVARDLDPSAVRTLDPMTIGPGGLGDLQDLNPEYRPKLAGLTVSQTSPAIDSGDNVLWFHVQSIDQPPGKTLYDVQLQLIKQLWDQRFLEERSNYIKSLFEKGIYTAMPEMSQRILTVALSRYSP